MTSVTEFLESATVDPDAYKASLRVVIDSGPEMRFGELRIRGLKRYPPEVITNLNQIKPGDMYSEAALQGLQDCADRFDFRQMDAIVDHAT